MTGLSSLTEIDRRVDLLLRESGALRRFPTPIEDILAAQRLSVSAAEDSPLAPGMIARAPKALREKLAAVQFKVLAVLDRRERVVHVSPDTDNTNHERFNKMHEVGHDVCIWQNLSHALDGRSQLEPGTRELFEREANHAGARLLFQGPVFTDLAQSYETNMASVVLLAAQLGGSIHAAFHQYVSTHLDSVAGYILRRSPITDPTTGTLRFGVKLALQSAKYSCSQQLPHASEGILSSVDLPDLATAWQQISSGREYGTGEVHLLAVDGSESIVPIEMFSNTYNVFLLIDASRRRALARKVSFASAHR